MKTNTLLLAAASAILLLAGRVQASDSSLSPKAAQLRHDLRTAPGTADDMLARSARDGSPKGQTLAYEFRRVPGTTPDLLARGPMEISPKTLSNEPWRAEKFQVAPLK